MIFFFSPDGHSGWEKQSRRNKDTKKGWNICYEYFPSMFHFHSSKWNCISSLKRHFSFKSDTNQKEKKLLKRGLSSWKERKQIALDKTSTCRWFKWSFLWLVLHFNNTLEIFRFQFNVHWMCFACELLNWKTYYCSAILPSPRWFLLNTILFSCQWLLWACLNGMYKCDIWG